MELFFNEISGLYREANLYGARARMESLLALCKRAKGEGFNLLRTDREFDFQELTDGYRVSDWYGDSTVSRTMKDLFLGFRKFPYESGDEQAEEAFLAATYRLSEPDEPKYHGTVAAGLAWAYIWETLSVSFPVNAVWKRTRIRLREERDGIASIVVACHASEAEHIAFHEAWIASLKEVVLVQTDLSPGEKEITLRNDHGKDRLTAFAKKLAGSPYVTGVINSLPFNPNSRGFIRNSWPDGRVELVLIWTDEGLGMVVQTTGRNLRETEAIANILKQEYA